MSTCDVYDQVTQASVGASALDGRTCTGTSSPTISHTETADYSLHVGTLEDVLPRDVCMYVCMYVG